MCIKNITPNWLCMVYMLIETDLIKLSRFFRISLKGWSSESLNPAYSIRKSQINHAHSIEKLFPSIGSVWGYENT